MVFVGTVKSVKSADSRKFGDEYNFNDLQTTFYIDEPLKGVKSKEIDIYTSSQGTACGIEFEPGEQYLIYAYEEGSKIKYLSTSICSRSRDAGSRKDEIAVLRSISNGAFIPRIYGRVEEIIRGIYLLDDLRNVPMYDVLVTASNGENVYRTRTDLGGNFSFINIRKGIYRLDVKLPSTYKLRDDSWNFVSKTGTDFVYEVTASDSPDFITIETRINGRIRGRVVAESGKPVGKGVRVSLISRETAEKEVGDIKYMPTSTDGSGNFEFYGIPPGEYYVGFNLETRPGKDFPYPRTYYPGTPEVEKAKIIVLGKGDAAEGLVLNLPKKVEEIKVRGRVVDAEGKPVSGAIVERYGLYSREWRESDDYSMQNILQPTFEGRVETDENGEFTLML
ncbi:MAG: hypothetical protein JSS81_01870 [Acidobacteria bacterium]|nr:hypothetical protein [Acidobacteriota bacterium]